MTTAFAGVSGAASSTGDSSPLAIALNQLVGLGTGPPGAIAVVQQGTHTTVYGAGTSVAGTGQRVQPTDFMRVASVAKAYSGAVALKLVSDHVLSLSTEAGQLLPGLPAAWKAVTLRQLLDHTSGIPDFSNNAKFLKALIAAPFNPEPPARFLSYVYGTEMAFTPPGSAYHYSNSDNVLVALMVEAATGHSYGQELNQLVLDPFGLNGTSLPTNQVIPSPYLHGYEVLPGPPPDGRPTYEDVSQEFAAGWTWASGGVVSTPYSLNAFMRAYVSGTITGLPASQESFVPGASEPAGPGTNSAGLAVFRYQTPCGTVYGHTGNTPGYTQFAAASADGSRSVVVSVNAQYSERINPATLKALQHIDALGVCAALAS